MNILVTCDERDVVKPSPLFNIDYLKVNDVSMLGSTVSKYEVLIGGQEIKHLQFTDFISLKWIQLISAGYEYLPKDLNKEIIVTNAKDVYSDAIAEWVISYLFAHSKNVFQAFSNQLNHKWDRSFRVTSLKDKKIIIFGTGSIGSAIAKTLHSLDIQVDGVNSSGAKVALFDKTYVLEDFVDFVDKYDMFIFCLPSNATTHDYLNAQRIMAFNSGSVIINVGRGDLIPLDAIVLRSDVSFILDVHHQEPLSEVSELWDKPNIIISPHIAFKSPYWRTKLENVIAINLHNYYHGSTLINRVK